MNWWGWSQQSEALQTFLADCSGALLCRSVIQCCLLRHPTREFPSVFSWLSLLWHALLFFAFCVHSESPPGVPLNETLHDWGSEAIKSDCFCQTLGANIINSHLPENDLHVDMAEFENNRLFFLWFDGAVFQKAQLHCYSFAMSWLKVLYLRREYIEKGYQAMVKAWSFTLQNLFGGRDVFSCAYLTFTLL